MLKKILDVGRYIVRTTGLFFVGCLALLLIASPVIGDKPSVLTALGGVWLLAAAVLSWPRVPDAWRKDPPTQRQLEYAESLGLVVPAGISKGQLSDMISQATGR